MNRKYQIPGNQGPPAPIFRRLWYHIIYSMTMP